MTEVTDETTAISTCKIQMCIQLHLSINVEQFVTPAIKRSIRPVIEISDGEIRLPPTTSGEEVFIGTSTAMLVGEPSGDVSQSPGFYTEPTMALADLPQQILQRR
ncbi:MAG: hypothetical protein Q9166_007743 [cf. Caloplaca sp. 2 TL-2023]